VSLRVVVPSDPSSPYAFAGQTLSLVAQLGHTVAALKEQLSSLLGSGAGKQVLPANKIKLQFTSEATGADTYLNKDNATLAFYNVPADCTMQLGVKERGGKK
jgi:splicing factor 3A subunit 1